MKKDFGPFIGGSVVVVISGNYEPCQNHCRPTMEHIASVSASEMPPRPFLRKRLMIKQSAIMPPPKLCCGFCDARAFFLPRAFLLRWWRISKRKFYSFYVHWYDVYELQLAAYKTSSDNCISQSNGSEERVHAMSHEYPPRSALRRLFILNYCGVRD